MAWAAVRSKVVVLLLCTFCLLLLPIVGVCNCSILCCTLLYVNFSFAIILMGKREMADLLSLSSWCLVMVVWLFLAVPLVCLRFVIVVFPDHIHLLFLIIDICLKCTLCTERNVFVCVRGGSCNLQSDTIVKHNRSAEHKEAEQKTLSLAAAVPCEEFVTEADGVTVDDDYIKLFRTVFYAACEDLPPGKVNSLLELRTLNRANIKYKNLSWDTVSEIQGCIKAIFQRDLVASWT